MITYRKDVNETIRKGFDWSDWLLDNDRVVSSSWTVGQGLTAGTATFGDTYSDIDLSGGTSVTQYRVTNQVTTNEGLVYERSFKVMVVDR